VSHRPPADGVRSHIPTFSGSKHITYAQAQDAIVRDIESRLPSGLTAGSVVLLAPGNSLPAGIIGYTLALLASDLQPDGAGGIDRTATAQALATRAYSGFSQLGDGAKAQVLSYLEGQLPADAASLVPGTVVSLYGYIQVADAVHSATLVTDYGYRKIGAGAEPGAVGSYVVHPGDTLESIAAAVYGSRDYWYLIAEANGLRGSEPLVAGTRLTIPNAIANSFNRYDSYAVYNSADIIGATSPGTRFRAGEFQRFAQVIITIILIVVAIIVTIVSAGIATSAVFGAYGLLAAALFGFGVGVVASAVTQQIAIEVGLQDKFDAKKALKAGLLTAVTAVASYLSAAASASAQAGAGVDAAAEANFAAQTADEVAQAAQNFASATNQLTAINAGKDIGLNLTKAGIELGKQLIQNDGKVNNWAAVAIAALGGYLNVPAIDEAVGGGLSRGVAEGALNLVEARIRNRELTALDYTRFATTAIGGYYGSFYDNNNVQRGSTNYFQANPNGTTTFNGAQLARELTFTGISSVVAARTDGEEAGINELGSGLGRILGNVLTQSSFFQTAQQAAFRGVASGFESVSTAIGSLFASNDPARAALGADALARYSVLGPDFDPFRANREFADNLTLDLNGQPAEPNSLLTGGGGGLFGFAASGLANFDRAQYIANRLREGAVVAAGDGPGIVILGGNGVTIEALNGGGADPLSVNTDPTGTVSRANSQPQPEDIQSLSVNANGTVFVPGLGTVNVDELLAPNAEARASNGLGFFDRISEVASDPNLPRVEKFRRITQQLFVPGQYEAERANAPVNAAAIATGALKELGNLGLFVLENVAGGPSGAPVDLPRFELTPEEQRGAAAVQFLSLIGGTGTIKRVEGAAGVANSEVAASRPFIFRGDARSPEAIFTEGFQPKGTSQDLFLKASQNTDSIFVSTSKSPNVAREFASYQGDGYVYTIRGQPQGVDVNAVLGSRSPFPHELEIAVPGGIKPVDIMGARQIGSDGRFIGPFIKNPGYK